MEQLYPRNILERHYPVLREQREREERAEEAEPEADPGDTFFFLGSKEIALHENEPVSSGPIGSNLNTIA